MPEFSEEMELEELEALDGFVELLGVSEMTEEQFDRYLYLLKKYSKDV